MPASRMPFVGRERELHALSTQLALAAGGIGRLVLVAGEPGIGKTRLLGEFAAATSARGWLVLAGRAYEGEGLPPYLPFMEALGGCFAGRSRQELRELLGYAAAGVAHLLPELQERLPGLAPRPALSPEHERYRLFESVCDVLVSLARAAESRGLLLTLDDLHWADAPSLLLLRHLARRAFAAPLLVIGAYRREDLGGEHPLLDLLAALRREALGETLTLAPLADEAAALLVAQLAGTAPAPGVATAIQRQAEGNPFFLGEVVRHLSAEGVDLADPGAAGVRIGLPEGVREVIGRRLARLSTAALTALQAAAVLGDGVRFAELREASGLAEEPLLDALDALLAAGMLREAGQGYQFGHALIRETVYAALGLARRQRLHRRAAEAIERLHAGNLTPHVAALANHWRLAGPAGYAQKALSFARQAAQQAEAVFAWETAATHWQTALDALAMIAEPDPGGRCDLLLALGEARQRAGDYHAAQAAFVAAMEHAKALGSADRFARGALGFAGRWTNGEGGERTRDYLDEATGLLSAGDSVLRVSLLARRSVQTFNLHDHPGWLRESRALCEEAVAAARRIADPKALLTALNAQHLALWSPDLLAQRRAIAAEMIAIAGAVNDPEMKLEGRHWLIIDLLESGDRSEYDAELAAYEREVRALRQPFYSWPAFLTQAMTALLEGRFADAEALANEALRVGRSARGAEAVEMWQIQRCALLFERGQLAALDGYVRTLPQPETRGLLLGPLAGELGRREEAKSWLNWIAGIEEDWLADPTRSLYFPAVDVVAAEVCAILGERTHAASLYALLRPYADQIVVDSWAVQSRGPIAYYLGLLASTLEDWDTAERRFAEAAAIAARIGAKPYEARSRHGHAAMLLRRGRRGDAGQARELLAAAVATYDALGMGYWAEKARALLADRRLAAARTPAYPDGLSAREVEVLRLIAAGQSTQEIAAALTISPGTVERHVTNLYRKIGARNRAEAGRYAHRHGVIAPAGC